MITIVFHSTPIFENRRKAENDLMNLVEEIDDPITDVENDNFYFTLDTDRERGLELGQALEKMGYIVTVKDDVEAYFA